MAFRALGRTGLALSLGLTALAAYQNVRDAMAETPAVQSRRLDISGPREVVFCHQCQNEWWRDEHGLCCPRCDSDITEIIAPDNDPRPPEVPPAPTAAEIESLRGHNPWQDHDDDSDPEEADINELLPTNPRPGYHATVYTRTFSGPPRQVFASGSSRNNPPSQTALDFRSMINDLMGPSHSPLERQGEQDFHNLHHRPWEHPLGGEMDQASNAPGSSQTQGSPQIIGTRFTFQFGRPPQTIVTNGPAVAGNMPNINTFLRDLLLLTNPQPGDNNRNDNGLQGLQGLLASLLNPAMAVNGDAVYTQEALDRIISNLMEQNPSSNAPGPAPEEALASLPKKAVDLKMLGAEGKAECSVCMDEVALDDEVIELPCKHWFHEDCAKAWLREHNTCPICRTGVGRDGSAVRRESSSNANENNQNNNDAPQNMFMSMPAAGNIAAQDAERLPQYGRRSTFLRRRPSESEARLASIRSTAGLDPALRNPSGSERNSAHHSSSPAGNRRGRSPSPPPNWPGAFSEGDHWQRNATLRRNLSDTDAGSTGRRERQQERDRDRDGQSSGASTGIGGLVGSLFRRFGSGGSGR